MCIRGRHQKTRSDEQLSLPNNFDQAKLRRRQKRKDSVVTSLQCSPPVYCSVRIRGKHQKIRSYEQLSLQNDFKQAKLKRRRKRNYSIATLLQCLLPVQNSVRIRGRHQKKRSHEQLSLHNNLDQEKLRPSDLQTERLSSVTSRDNCSLSCLLKRRAHHEKNITPERSHEQRQLPATVSNRGEEKTVHSKMKRFHHDVGDTAYLLLDDSVRIRGKTPHQYDHMSNLASTTISTEPS